MVEKKEPIDEEAEVGSGKVRALIEKATNTTAPEVDPRLLKAIKSMVRYSESELRISAQTLMDLMKRDHSQVRYLTLLIIDELFMRSKLFRMILVGSLDQLLTLSVGFRRNLPLPAPPAIASVLRSKAIEFLEKWNSAFGVHYRQIRLGFTYLKNTLQYQFPNLQANAARLQQERMERERRSKEILLNKYEMLKESIASVKDEIQFTINEIGGCLDILNTKENRMPPEPLDEEDFEEFRSSELRQIRLDSLREGEKVHENEDNKVIFDALRELYRVLVTKHLISVQEWISVLIRVETEDNRCRESLLKEFISIRNQIQLVRKECEEAGCSLPHIINQEEEDFWDEGKDESGNNGSEEICLASTSSEVKTNAPAPTNESKPLGCKSTSRNEDSLRSKLLNEAPVLKWDSFLSNWGSDCDVLANRRGLDLENHWGRVDLDAVIPARQILESNVQTTIYEEQRAEIQPCRAPLSKGRLCQRRDLRVCPFHGPIVPRDDEGRPVNPSSSQEEEQIGNLGNRLVGKLTEQAVKNVRDRDREALMKRESDKKAMKRAKLAKIKEHNAAVLRDASLASTSGSSLVGEDTYSANIEKVNDRKMKQSLASMLRKKVTTKDKLAQRLLDRRARGATTRQLLFDEDANYREAFPNQW